MKFNKFWLICCLLPGAVLAQKNTAVRLRWGLVPGDTLHYLTRMENLDKEEEPDALFASFAQPQVLMSELTCPRAGLIHVEQYSVASADEQAEMLQMLDAMWSKDTANATSPRPSLDSARLEVQQSLAQRRKALSGGVYANGGVQSFYLPSGQKNLVALFFELPKQPVRVGDTWDLDVQLISFAGTCDSAFERHSVCIKALEKRGKEQVAVLEYDFVEYVSGELLGATTLSFSYHASCEFGVQQGRWLAYEGVMEILSKGMFGKSLTRQRFALERDGF